LLLLVVGHPQKKTRLGVPDGEDSPKSLLHSLCNGNNLKL